MYIEQAYKGLTDAWRYIVGGAIIFFAWQILGAIPLMAGIFINMDGFENFPSDISGMVALLGNNLFLFLMLISFALGLIGVFISSKYLHKLSIKNLTTTRKKIDWKRFCFIFLLWGGITTGMVLLDYYYITPENYVFNFQLKPFLILLVIGIFLLPLQTSFEEYAFRGYGMHFLGTLCKNRWVPLIITSVAFGLMHILNPEVEKLGYIIMVYYIGTGFFLGIITLMDEGLELALGFHFANNLFTALLVTTDWTVLQTDSILKDISDPSEMVITEIIVPVLVVFPILLFILSKKYKWTNWKDKLFGPVVEPTKEDYKILED
ncbi:CPBP family intramembrane glutamic endopeptidase [Hyunsoonleella pacifica]|uniref:CPBP family intramembrane metalloprotease n=1 Tax=Hyunsoonleella pacifica TaxID=1080224 RepID=A0A4Q9FR07_9FLAO|nr:type II CAAX endopeptidase family protein [Hyunsoonleella pacifica]TBN17820.1 CPBP family intramembrane metalloprotease [Hyunsoonleella pacifica]GGD08696.1 abortive infection protein [Hyunsoonleella pacifica]